MALPCSNHKADDLNGVETIATTSLSSRLDSNLSSLLRGTNIYVFGRVQESRLATTALPNIGLIELVSADAFTKLYNAMYISMFPNTAEREHSNLICDRLRKEFAGERTDLAPYRIVGIRSHDGTAIGAAQFSVLMLENGRHAVPYLQYIYVREENRRQDMAEVLHMMVLAVASADAIPRGRSVPFTLFETEPTGHGDNEAARRFATQRIHIHSKAGAVGLMLRRQEANGVVVLVSPHCQPGLEVGEPPLSLLWAVRKSPATPGGIDVAQIGHNLIAAYYQSLRDENFPEENIQLAEKIVAERCRDSEYVSVPLNEIVIPRYTYRHVQT